MNQQLEIIQANVVSELGLTPNHLYQLVGDSQQGFLLKPVTEKIRREDLEHYYFLVKDAIEETDMLYMLNEISSDDYMNADLPAPSFGPTQLLNLRHQMIAREAKTLFMDQNGCYQILPKQNAKCYMKQK